MRTYDFVCLNHPEEIKTITASSRKKIPEDHLKCASCDTKMESYFGNSSPTMNLAGNSWPKRDIKETARRKKRSKYLALRQKEVWDPKMPKLNLDPEVQAEARKALKKEISKKKELEVYNG